MSLKKINPIKTESWTKLKTHFNEIKNKEIKNLLSKSFYKYSHHKSPQNYADLDNATPIAFANYPNQFLLVCCFLHCLNIKFIVKKFVTFS